MTRFTLSLAALVAAASLSLSSCSKKSDPVPNPKPDTNKPGEQTGKSYGTGTYDGTQLNFTISETGDSDPDDPTFSLVNAAVKGSKVYVVGVHLVEKPTRNATYLLGGDNYVVVTDSDTTDSSPPFHVFMESNEQVSVTVTNGKVKASFSNLTESTFNGDTPDRPVKLTATISEK